MMITKQNKVKWMSAALAGMGLVGSANAQGLGNAISAGAGFMESSNLWYGYIKGDLAVYEDELFIHKFGLEYIGYRDVLSPGLSTDLNYTTLVANYEIEYKASRFVSLFMGAGAGVQAVDLDSPAGSLDDDTLGYAQIVGGVKAHLTESMDLNLRLRRMFFDEYSLLGVGSLKQEQTWGIDLGVVIRF